MVALQILSKCLAEGSIDFIEDNQLTEEYFTGYEQEFNFIKDHYKKFGNVPDKATFLSKFPDIELVKVTETDKYLIDTVQEEYLYYKSIPVVQKIADLLKTDSNAAVEYMLHATKTLQPNYDLGGTDIVAEAKTRYDEFLDRKQNQSSWFFSSGFDELDAVIHGIQRIEEFILIYARTNMGKSWLLEAICEHIWEQGFNVGYISPEMGPSSIGYRFDTLYKHYDNKALTWSNGGVDENEYKAYIDRLAAHTNKFIVATPAQFDRKITATKLKKWIKKHDIHAIAIDGITYLTDERGKKGDNKTTALTNISEDLIQLSIEMNVPVLAVAQANRGGVIDKDKEDLPELDNIRDSDGMAFNATKVISLRQDKYRNLLLEVKKQRNGLVGVKLAYKWNANIGEFLNIPVDGNDFRETRKTAKKAETKEDVF